MVHDWRNPSIMIDPDFPREPWHYKYGKIDNDAVDQAPCPCEDVDGPHTISDFHPGVDDVPDYYDDEYY